MFEGLLSPWHLVIIAFVVFMVFGPKKLAERWEGVSHTVKHWVDDDGDPSTAGAAEPAPAPEPKPSWSRRFARRLARLRRRRRRR